MSITAEQSELSPHVIVRGDATSFLQEIVAGKHRFRADEPADAGGRDDAPTPYDYLLAALGTCTSMTVGLYARRKQLPLKSITVALWHSRIHARDCEDCDTKEGTLDSIEMRLTFEGSLSPEQQSRLMEIAAKCPVHRTLTSEIKISLRDADSV